MGALAGVVALAGAPVHPIGGEVSTMSDLPEAAFSVDLRGLVATLAVADDGEPALTIGDDQNAITLETGMGGSYEDAVDGVARLYERVGQLLAILQVRIGDRQPLTPRSAPEDDRPIDWVQPDELDADRRVAGLHWSAQRASSRSVHDAG